MNIQDLEKQLQQVEKEYTEIEFEENFKRALQQYHGEDEIISFQKYKKILAQEEKANFSIKSGIPLLDKIIRGFAGGELVVVSGPTGQGKTTLCQTFTQNFSKQNINPLWFSYEVSGRDFLAKFGENLPSGYLPKTLISNKLVWIERKIVEAIAKFETKVVFIDHLHYLCDFSKMRNPSLEIGGIVRELKMIAVKYNIVICLIAHTAKVKFGEKIGLDDIRDSSFIGQESDYVFMIWRDHPIQSRLEVSRDGIQYSDTAILSVEKNRPTGKLGSVRLQMQKGLFVEETLIYKDENEQIDEQIKF